ncbi:class I SAM-dependent methyltransferase [Stella sp.]|uniref:class I SAM-dependent methyltransferase n=1 Tax=Stella sp. TaxID=2912054 RepID=UPI0035B215C9
MLFARFLGRLVRYGNLALVDADGRSWTFGDGAGAPVVVRLHDRSLHTKLALKPELHVGEAYMDGTLTIEQGDLYDFLLLATENLARMPEPPVLKAGRAVERWLRGLRQYNPVGKAKANVAHHYDLSGRLYDLFLDADRQYSCAYFTDPGDDLETAQRNKKRHLAAKLLLQPGQKVLDIGCGWGGLALYLAQTADVDVTGLTLSEEQHKVAEERARKAGLSDRVRFLLRDYREEKGRYDRIVSVGMFEHVGVRHYPAFFHQVRDLLTPDGVALLHSIGRSDGPGATNPWLRKYIFPGGYSPALSEVLPVVERTGLFVTDIEILRLHYAHTLRHWRQRFLAHRDEIRRIYDERFCRMWEFYLVGCELAFVNQGHMVFQMQMSRSLDTVPLTRDYIPDWEQRTDARANIAA